MPRLVPAVATEDVVYVPEELEPGTGRTPRQIKDMAKNAPKQPELDSKDKSYARMIAKQQANYPKIMYAPSKWKKVEDDQFGDEIVFIDGDMKTPLYPLYELQHRGKTIPVFERMPYKTMLVSDEGQEKAAIRKGYIDSPGKLKYEWEQPVIE